jgi:hypothetical protein
LKLTKIIIEVSQQVILRLKKNAFKAGFVKWKAGVFICPQFQGSALTATKFKCLARKCGAFVNPLALISNHFIEDLKLLAALAA